MIRWTRFFRTIAGESGSQRLAALPFSSSDRFTPHTLRAGGIVYAIAGGQSRQRLDQPPGVVCFICFTRMWSNGFPGPGSHAKTRRPTLVG